MSYGILFESPRNVHDMIVADVTFYPIGKGISVADTIKEAISQLRSEGLKCYPNSMATVIETDTVDHLFSGIAKVEASIVGAGFSRVETIVRIDHRVDVENSVTRKLTAIGENVK
jgi:uncharacterized protein (TIGR00106 family)